jgi:hypothetical protein
MKSAKSLSPVSITTDDYEDSISQDSLTPCLAALRKSLTAANEKLSFATEAFERPMQDLARTESAARSTRAKDRHSRERARALLALLTNNQLEKWIAASPNEELRSFFKKFWREDAKPTRKASAKPERNSTVVIAIPGSPATEFQSKDNSILGGIK